MSDKQYQSPDGPGLDLEDFHPRQTHDDDGSPHQIRSKKYQKVEKKMRHSVDQQRYAGGVVGHQQYGDWQEQNHFYGQGHVGMPQQEHMPMMMAHAGGHFAASAQGKRKRPQSSVKTKHSSGKMRR